MEGASSRRLEPDALRRRCDPALLGFATTAELPDLEALLGQDRASSALEFGTALRASDYNVFALGAPGLGKHAFVRRLLEERAAKQPIPSDWCYVHNFSDRSRPRAIRLPPGRGAAFKNDVANLLEELRAAIPRALESEEFRAKTKAVEHEEKTKRESALDAVRREAESAGVAVLGTPTGMALAAIRDGEVLGPEEFAKLPQEEKDRLNAAMEKMGAMLENVLKQAPRWHRESHVTVRKLARQATADAVHHLVEEVRPRFTDLPEVLRYLDELEKDVVENGEGFTPSGSEEPASPGEHELPIFRRYRVNLAVDNGSAKGAPVVYEDHPTHASLFGRVEHISVLGALLTDHNLLKVGAVQRANGGYLILDALKLLRQPFSWEELKRALRAQTVRIESPMEELGLASTVSLSPEAIPLDLKVVLIGERYVHALLGALDPDFRELFKIAADFEDDVPWTDESLRSYSRLLGTIARRHEVRPLEAGAVARIVEESARETGDRDKLSLDLQGLADVLREADRCAELAGKSTIGTAHVQCALDARVRRSDRIRDLVQDQIRRGTLLVDAKGSKVGQANGLSVIATGDFAFGRPTRITARARLGRGEVVDIDREVELGGPIHSKGVLILQGFLAGRYAAEMPLSLAATLVFEQSYGGVEGDSASLAELCALLSAIGEVPLDQSIAVTGSVNQHGNVQPVGGVNEKIEGFFDACKILGLTGSQGVAIPRKNIPNLMLRQEVVEAVAAGRFHVYAVDTVDETLELLAKKPAGERGADGEFPEDTVNAAVESRLVLFAAATRAFELPDEEHGDGREHRKRLIIGSPVEVGPGENRQRT